MKRSARVGNNPARDERYCKDGRKRQQFTTREEHAEWMRSRPQARRRLGIKRGMITVWKQRKAQA